MNKTVKRMLSFLVLLCAIVIIVFAVEVFVVNRDAENNQDTPPVDTSPPDIADTNPPGGDNTADSTAPPDSGDSESTGEPPVTNGAKLYEIPVPGGKTLMLRADETLFSHDLLDMFGDMFTYKDGTASLEISFIEGTEAIMLAPSFLDNYIDYIGGDFYIEGESKLGASDITGDLVIASNNGETYEAWLVDLEDGVLAFVVNFRDENRREELHKILDSAELVAS